MTQKSLFDRPPVPSAPVRHAIYLAVRPVVTEARPAPSGLFSLRARPAQAVTTRPLALAA